jgi:hypothetical protein
MEHSGAIDHRARADGADRVCLGDGRLGLDDRLPVRPGRVRGHPAQSPPAPRQVTADGRLAGLTRDGTTVAWVDSSGNLVEAPLDGGTPQTV